MIWQWIVCGERAMRGIHGMVTYFLAGDCPCIRYSAQVSSDDLHAVVVEIKDKMPFNRKKILIYDTHKRRAQERHQNRTEQRTTTCPGAWLLQSTGFGAILQSIILFIRRSNRIFSGNRCIYYVKKVLQKWNPEWLWFSD